jgi:hypothetical protein
MGIALASKIIVIVHINCIEYQPILWGKYQAKARLGCQITQERQTG